MNLRKHGTILWLMWFVLVGGALAACNQPGAQGPDLVATEVAVQQAAAATLTAAAQPASPSDTPLPPTPEPTFTQPPPQEIPAPTASEPTPTPVPPSPTPTPIVIAILPVDGSDPSGTLRSSYVEINDGLNVLLPGFQQDEITDPMVFRDRLGLRVEVFDSAIGEQDGAGIEWVRFQVEDANSGEIVYEKVEYNPAYCLFGGDSSACSLLTLQGPDVRWPETGLPIRDGKYLVRIQIRAQSGLETEWRWRFRVASGQAPSSPGYQARISGIRVQDGYYIVDFATEGFMPTLPGQHVHFFFDTVPPDQAGVPGAGPWKLYGGPSPFTEYAVSERPAGARQMCILVANPDHSVIPGTGNCVDLP